MKKILSYFNSGVEFVSAMMLGVMFTTFLLQIASRYFFNASLGWTVELGLTLWLWLAFFGNAFLLKHKDHVVFDIVYQNSSYKTRRIMATVSAIIIVAAFAWSFLPTWSYIDWLKIRKSAILKIPMKYVFSVYMLFLVGMIMRYSWRVWHIWKSDDPNI